MSSTEMGAVRYLIIGAAGFIGSHLCDAINLRKPENLVAVDNFFLGKMANIQGCMNTIRLERMDARKYDEMRSMAWSYDGFDVAVNCAVKPLLYSFEDPVDTYLTSVRITSSILELVRKDLIHTLVQISSSEAYGTARRTPMDEDHPLMPETPYAAGKASADHLALSYARTYGCDIRVIRPFNTYGPRQNERAYAGVVPTSIVRILSGRPPIVQGSGDQTRDFTYVRDTVNGILLATEKKEASGKVINIGSGQETKIADLVRLICRLLSYTGSITYEAERPGDVKRHRSDITRARQLLGFTPQVELEEGIKSTIEWFTRRGSSD